MTDANKRLLAAKLGRAAAWRLKRYFELVERACLKPSPKHEADVAAYYAKAKQAMDEFMRARFVANAPKCDCECHTPGVVMFHCMPCCNEDRIPTGYGKKPLFVGHAWKSSAESAVAEFSRRINEEQTFFADLLAGRMTLGIGRLHEPH
jgi:hypothetical protein